MSDLISRQAAIDAICDYTDDLFNQITALEDLPSVQPNLQPTCNQLATDCISRQAAIDRAIEVLEGLQDAQPEQQHGRIFQEIVVEYPSISTYPEYEGKPYFSIKYTENGQGFIGYGTYKPEVLSEYMIKHFMPSVQPNLQPTCNQLATDCISRQAAIDALDALCDRECEYSKKQRSVMCGACHLGSAFDVIEQLPSAQPERKNGEWQITDAYPHNVYCSECHTRFAQTHWAVWADGSLPRNFCPNCGADMRNNPT